MSDVKRITGIIYKWHAKDGYGYIGDGWYDYYFERADIIKKPFKLYPGNVVEFIPCTNGELSHAREVVIKRQGAPKWLQTAKTIRGTIEKVDMYNAYGWVLGDDGEYYFAHKQDVKNPSDIEVLEIGMKLEFQYFDTGKSAPKAVNISIINE